jgi:hypothetical protein
MDTSFRSLIDSASSILILLPIKPNFDQVVAGLSFYLSLHDTKNVNISCPAPMMVSFNRIIGINKITSDLGNKNLTLKFDGYEAANIEKVSYDIENGEFKLTVVPKAGLTAPQKEQLNLRYTGISSDLVILVGGTNDSDFPVLMNEEFKGVKIAHIGTRALISNHEVLSFATPRSSISELISNVIKENNYGMDVDIATNLVMGIEEGSGHFENSEVTPDTFEIFAWLLRNGGARPPKEKLSANNFPVGSIPTKPLNEKVLQVKQVEQVLQEENDASDPENPQEMETDINPPADWLAQPKVYKGAGSDSFSENKG